MKKIGIFYGTTTGTAKEIAEYIAAELGVSESDINDVSQTAPSRVADYDVLVIGASTWGDGDLQEDMDTWLDGVGMLDLRDKEVAIFGCGDESMSDTFCNSVGKIYHRLHDAHPEFIAPFNNEGYDYNHSESDVKGMIVGLCIDNVNHDDETFSRVREWCSIIKSEIA
ncbi:MAG: flavodoxin domain-containing protein [Duncaniella sp.]|nr:flavodoxin domain-containing protein [Duncaniella sp.]MDE6359255.1 flavodoxin domain-containing protein [Duncaniella sp.]